jgi:alpha-ketoglutarate-dependent sulfate ester dioxygenase
MKTNSLTIQKINPNFGLEVRHFDINNDQHTSQLKTLLDDYLVVVLKETPITRPQQIHLASLFGDVTLAHPVVPGNVEFPEVLEIDGAKGGKNAKWHTDVSFLEKPHALSILTGDQIPDAGGDTLWCDLRTSYDKINPHLKPFLNTLEAVHKVTPLAYWGEPFDYLISSEENKKLYENSLTLCSAIHPVVRIHPRTLKPAFFVNPGFTSHILDINPIENEHILKLIYEHTIQPEFVLHHRWHKNDVVIWDNICTAHYAVNNYGISERKMRRVTVKGEVPFGYNDIQSRKTTDPLMMIR